MGISSKKTRLTISINTEILKEFKRNIKDAGYPPGAMGWMVQEQMEKMNIFVAETGSFGGQLDLHFGMKDKKK